MPKSLPDEQVRLLRLHANRLLEPDAKGMAADVVKALVGIQAQDHTAAALAVRARSTGLTTADVARARNEERSIVRTWAMRGTLHWLAAEDIRWILALFGQDFIRKNRRRRQELGLDDETCARGVRALSEVLARRGALTRDEITEHLASQGIKLEGQARPHLLWVATLEGIVCGGPDRGAQPTYVLLDDWVPRGAAVPREEALTELARRYLAAYAPATLGDFAAWSGLALPDARRGWQALAKEALEVGTSRGPMSMLLEQSSWINEKRPPGPIVRLLGAFDAHYLGHRNRELVVHAEHVKRVNAGGGIVHPTLFVDGQVNGTWRMKRQRNQVEIILDPFDKLVPSLIPAIEAEVADIEHFLGMKVVLSAPGELSS